MSMNGQSLEGETFLTRQVSGNKADCRNKAASFNLQVLGCKIKQKISSYCYVNFLDNQMNYVLFGCLEDLGLSKR